MTSLFAAPVVRPQAAAPVAEEPSAFEMIDGRVSNDTLPETFSEAVSLSTLLSAIWH